MQKLRNIYSGRIKKMERMLADDRIKLQLFIMSAVLLLSERTCGQNKFVPKINRSTNPTLFLAKVYIH